ncbi:hypothetical protein KIPB_003808 [Kipferlia bialata]|uniref:Nuclear transport factor 2 n=1 Tax=Kipferlia bialata TaxID=797122 RepID=A0A9K3CW19_9EUKA|nr:hypothetical protein KIPB_003808 [Kipferlia bialata]|eukprot:g3808.t1
MADNQFDQVAQGFVQYYYACFDDVQKRGELRNVYTEMSLLTFQGRRYQGVTNIMEKLGALGFQTVAHRVNSIEAQPTFNNSVLVQVAGEMVTDGETDKPVQFCETFTLTKVAGQESYFVLNDIFRILGF